MVRRVFPWLRLPLIALVALALCAGFPPRASAAPFVLSGFPLLRQQHPLTCEASAASMATRAAISEQEIMRLIPRNSNPNLGFRGNPDRYQQSDLVDYGVYAQPVHDALLHYGYSSKVISYGNNDEIAAYVARGWPVVVWVTYGLARETPRLVQHNGVNFILVPREHAILVVGYGTDTLLANDPWNRTRVHYSWAAFDRSWGYFGNMALAVAPCPMARPVGSIQQATLTTSQATWAWPAARRAARYRVRIVLRGHGDTVVYQQDQSDRQVSLANPRPGAEYDLTVQSISSCGVVSAPTQFATLLPRSLPTPTPTPTQVEGTIVPTQTPVSTVTSTIEPQPSPTGGSP